MMPITPSGMRTRWILKPFGRSHSATVLPIGSASATTSATLRAIDSRRLSSSRNRSSSAPLIFAARAAAMSPALAARICSRRARMARAAAANATFFFSVPASANTAAVLTAALPSFSINSPTFTPST